MEDNLVQPHVAAERVICLMVFAARAYFEGEIQCPTDPDFDAAGSIALLDQWLQQEGLWEKLSEEETKLMCRQGGEWARQEQVSGGWRSESAGAIAWALGLLEMRPYDIQFRPGHVMDVIPERGQPTGEWIAKAAFRPCDDITEQRDVAELWLWRARAEHSRRTDPDREPVAGMTYDQIIAESASNCQKSGWFTALEDDFPAMGKPYFRLAEAEFQIMHSIAWERLYGLNWLCDEQKDWDRVECDT